ncbi:MAG TPA: hypothetical protein VK060_05735 [Ruania sp.]|nr:hypothetical protein [Ruania sp.]
MTTPGEQHRADGDTTGPMAVAHPGPRWRRARAVPVAALTSMLLAAGATQAMAAPGPDAAPDTREAPGVNATDTDWQDWSAQLEAEARTTDWAADSAARGCELISVDIVSTTVPEGTLRGAPEDLQVPVVEREEDCTAQASVSTGSARPDGAMTPMASACASTSGPGTVCLSRSGSYLSASFTYRGSGTIAGFIRAYERSSSGGCGSGSTLGTSAERSYSNGTTRTLSTYQPGYGHYSARFWKDVWWGHQNLGTVCRSV